MQVRLEYMYLNTSSTSSTWNKKKKNIYFVYFYLKLTPPISHPPCTFLNHIFYPTPSMYNSSLKTTPSPWKMFTDKKWALKNIKWLNPPRMWHHPPNHLVYSSTSQSLSPRILQASWISLGCKVTCRAWITRRFASSKRVMRYSSDASCSASTAPTVHRGTKHVSFSALLNLSGLIVAIFFIRLHSRMLMCLTILE